MRSLFPHLSPLGAVAGGCHDSSSPIELQKYAKAVRALAHLQGDFEALESGARARVFVNHTWLEAGTVFFERGGIAGAAVMGSDNVLLAFWMFFHAEVNQPHVRKNLELGARYMRRYSK